MQPEQLEVKSRKSPFIYPRYTESRATFAVGRRTGHVGIFSSHGMPFLQSTCITAYPAYIVHPCSIQPKVTDT
jgi:hypothetical protein